MKEHIVRKTIISMIILLLFFFMQGAIAVVNNLGGAQSACIRGAVIWALVLFTVVFYFIRYRDLTLLGFRKPKEESYKKSIFYIPLIVIALSNLVCGVDTSYGAGFIFANLFLTLGIGFAEEIYFRGIICNLWEDRGVKKAVAVSAILFGVCHLMNVLGGAGIAETILQICFALLYGIVVSLIFIRSKSIWPCIILHAFHDFCSFISCDGTLQLNIIIGIIQFIILLWYAVFLSKRIRA